MLTPFLSFFNDLNLRFKESDWMQLSLSFFSVLVITLSISFPSTRVLANDTFFSIAQVRLVCLIVIALTYGTLQVKASLKRQRLTFAALLVLALVSIPFEVAGYTMSFPDLPLYWTLLITTIDTLAFYVIGHGLGRVLILLRLYVLLPLAIPSLLVLFVAVDVFIARNLLSPLVAVTAISLPHLFLMTALATLGVILIFVKPILNPKSQKDTASK